MSAESRTRKGYSLGLRGVRGDADQRGAKELVAELVAAANLFEDLVIGMLHGFDAAERLVDSRVELRADGLDRLHIEGLEGFFHLLDDELHAAAQLRHVAVGLSASAKLSITPRNGSTADWIA